MVTTSTTSLCFCTTVVNLRLEPLCIGRLREGGFMNAHDSDRSLSCCVNPFEHLDVAQQVDELLFLHTNIRLRHQRNKVPLHLLQRLRPWPICDCSQLLRFRNKQRNPTTWRKAEDLQAAMRPTLTATLRKNTCEEIHGIVEQKGIGCRKNISQFTCSEDYEGGVLDTNPSSEAAHEASVHMSGIANQSIARCRSKRAAKRTIGHAPDRSRMPRV